MDLYYISPSSPCRAVLLTAKAVGVELNKKVVNLMEGAHMKPEFLDINFQHTIPTLVDGDFTLWESRAICTYLVSKYGKDDSLYPKCPKQRALVDRMLYFDYGLSATTRNYYYPVMFLGEKADPSKLDKIQELYADLNTFLEGHDYAVGNHITVADHCLVAAISSQVAMGIDISKHSNIVAWLARCKINMPGYESENEEGAKLFGDMVRAKINA